MNKLLSNAGKQIIKDLLKKCTIEQQNKFRLIYSYKNKEAELEYIINNLDDYDIDNAISLCERTVEKNMME